jgi:magnesium-protoporphyrin IX monomethyl ester (oxidative) cyclase
VFRITSDISKQVFPLSLNIDDPRFRRGLQRLLDISRAIAAAKERGGPLGLAKRIALAGAAAAVFARLYLLPVHDHALPEHVRAAAVW